jgi:hypothetical protein
VRVVGEAEVTGEPGEIGFALGYPLQRQADPQPVPVLAHGAAGAAHVGDTEAVAHRHHRQLVHG